MAKRHHIELSFIDGKRQLLIDGEKLQGVRSATVTLEHNDIPHVFVELLPASVSFTGEGDAELYNAMPAEDDELNQPHGTFEPAPDQPAEELVELLERSV